MKLLVSEEKLEGSHHFKVIHILVYNQITRLTLSIVLSPVPHGAQRPDFPCIIP